jgi:hypothetical protein
LLVAGLSIALVTHVRWVVLARPALHAQPPVADALTAMPPRSGPWLMYRHTGRDANRDRIAWVPLAGDGLAVAGPPVFAPRLRCIAVYAAGDRGTCLATALGVPPVHRLVVFDPRDFRVLQHWPLQGLPSRTRVSADARYAASTVFVTGHGYASATFSTQTLLYDLRTMRVLGDLESFTTLFEGRVVRSPDMNFWGVTFGRDSNRFHATLSSAGRFDLVRGDIAARRVEVIHADVECPSVSPDGRHVAFKRRRPGARETEWQLHVLELATGRTWRLTEQRSIDDQLEWLDAATVLYTVASTATGDPARGSGATELWRVPIGGGAPRRFLAAAASPVVMRWSGSIATAQAPRVRTSSPYSER